LFLKLKFADFDLAKAVKIILNQDEDKVDLMMTKNLEKNSDIFLFDHAWSFRYQDAFDTLISNPSLVSRLENLTEFSQKLELPSNINKPTLSLEQAFTRDLQRGGRVFELENFGISSLANLAWPD
jgi:hypothetical protein